jgi:hypothetical protein
VPASQRSTRRNRLGLVVPRVIVPSGRSRRLPVPVDPAAGQFDPAAGQFDPAAGQLTR